MSATNKDLFPTLKKKGRKIKEPYVTLSWEQSLRGAHPIGNYHISTIFGALGFLPNFLESLLNMLTFGELFLFSFIEKLIPGYIEIIALAMHMMFAEAWGAFHSTKYSGLKFRVFYATNGTVISSSLD